MYIISHKQKQRLRGYSDDENYGPYSEVHLITETRILDNHVSRTMMFVEANINPLTFEIIAKNVDKFDEEDKVADLVELADFRGDRFGYVVGFPPVFEVDPDDKKMMNHARRDLEPFRKEAEKLMIKFHMFVMNLLDIGK